MKKIIGCIFGVLFVGLGIYWLIHRYNLRKACTVQVRGDVSFIPYDPDSKDAKNAMKELKIIKSIAKFIGVEKDIEKVEERQKLGIPIMYYEVITFSVKGVEHVVKTGHRDKDNFKYSMGQNVVTVLYDPSNPDRYRVLEKKGEIIAAVMFVILGSIFAIVSWNL